MGLGGIIGFSVAALIGGALYRSGQAQGEEAERIRSEARQIDLDSDSLSQLTGDMRYVSIKGKLTSSDPLAADDLLPHREVIHSVVTKLREYEERRTTQHHHSHQQQQQQQRDDGKGKAASETWVAGQSVVQETRYTAPGLRLIQSTSNSPSKNPVVHISGSPTFTFASALFQLEGSKYEPVRAERGASDRVTLGYTTNVKAVENRTLCYVYGSLVKEKSGRFEIKPVVGLPYGAHDVDVRTYLDRRRDGGSTMSTVGLVIVGAGLVGLLYCTFDTIRTWNT